jgi:hypothetical protein
MPRLRWLVAGNDTFQFRSGSSTFVLQLQFDGGIIMANLPTSEHGN